MCLALFGTIFVLAAAQDEVEIADGLPSGDEAPVQDGDDDIDGAMVQDGDDDGLPTGDALVQHKAKLQKLKELRQNQLLNEEKANLASRTIFVPEKETLPVFDKSRRPNLKSFGEGGNDKSGLRDILYQGDILLTPEQLDGKLQDAEAELNAVAGNGTSQVRRIRKVQNPLKRWPNRAAIPYFFAAGAALLPTQTRTFFLQFFAIAAKKTCLRFKQQTSTTHSKDAIRLHKTDVCYSELGYTGGTPVQNIGMADWCLTEGTVQHEVGYALGLDHEHARTDRDNFITVDLNNVLDGWKTEFPKQPTTNYFAYEYGSAMHYSASFVTNGNGLTMKAKAPNTRYQRTMGNEEGMSFMDFRTLNRAYCADKCANANTACKNGGYPNPNNCAVCLCPDGFAGTLCQARNPGVKRTCGATLSASTAWKSVRSTVGTDVADGWQKCTWWITAPAGWRVQVKVTAVAAGFCINGCYDGHVEMKPNKFPFAGIYACCAADLNIVHNGGTLFPVVVSGYYNMAFTFQYR